VLTPILATDDPYEAAALFVKAGWSLVFQTPRDSGDPLTCVDLAGARLLLGTSLPQFLPAESRAHRGAGVEFHLTVPSEKIGAVYEEHRRHAESVPVLGPQPWASGHFTRFWWVTSSSSRRRAWRRPIRQQGLQADWPGPSIT
jgi:hypothetical protein